MSSPSIWASGRYESVAEHIASIADEVVAAADRRVPLRGGALVDLACGTGSAAFAAAAKGATVTAVDLTPELVAIGAAKDVGGRITWLTADASDTGLPRAEYDAVVSNMGIIFVAPDPQVAELARLLKPGGVLCFSSWIKADDNPFFDPIVTVLGAPPTGGHSPDQWADPTVVEQRLSPAFTDLEVTERTFTWEFASPAAALHFLVHESPMHVNVFRHVDEGQRNRLTAAFRDAIEPHTEATGVHFDTPYAVVSATRR